MSYKQRGEKKELLIAEVEIHKRKQESYQEKKNKERKHALDQESHQEKMITVKKKRKKTRSRQRKRPRKKENFLSFFLLSCFLL